VWKIPLEARGVNYVQDGVKRIIYDCLERLDSVLCATWQNLN